MRPEEIDSIEKYEQYLRATLTEFAPQQRLAFVAALAEHWLPVYEHFSAKEQWGDPEGLHRILDAVWDHVRGSVHSSAEREQYSKHVVDNTPDMDEFDAWEALTACRILDHALECCEASDNAAIVEKAALAGIETALGEWPSDPEEQKDAWYEASAQKELARQLALLQKIATISGFDGISVQALRSGLALW